MERKKCWRGKKDEIKNNTRTIDKNGAKKMLKPKEGLNTK